MEFVDVVDKKDRVIGKSTADICRKKGYIHRVALIFVFDSKKRILLQQRHRLKDHSPLHWTASAGGRVKRGETYKEGALRELTEELGIVPKKILFVGKNLYQDQALKTKKHFLASFIVYSDGPFKIDKTHIEKVKFFSIKEIKNMVINAEKFQPEILYALKKRFDFNIDLEAFLKKYHSKWL